YFVDQLSTCIPFLRIGAHTRVLFYCHFPDKLLADGAYVEGRARPKGSLLKRIYRLPMDTLEELTTKQADTVLANSQFTARVFKEQFRSIDVTPRVVYPGINLDAYTAVNVDRTDSDINRFYHRPTLLSLNRFEQKKNAALAIDAFARLRKTLAIKGDSSSRSLRLVLAGGYDPRLLDNVKTLQALLDNAKTHDLTYSITTPSTSTVALPSLPSEAVSSTGEPEILFLLNFSTAQRSALLTSPSTLALLYTPANEHFGIGPVEGMVCGLPVLACDSGGPTESIIDQPSVDRTGWLRRPDPEVWAEHWWRSSAYLENALQETVAKGPVPTPFSLWIALALLAVLLACTTRIPT
ncbi:hypothetical protein BD414DRAFT_498651, partial [Trametes punicea]